MSGVEIVTFGCRLNAYESQAIRARAAEAGLTDAVIVNTCAVTAEAVRQSRQAIRKQRRERPARGSSSQAARRRQSPKPTPRCRKWITCLAIRRNCQWKVTGAISWPGRRA